MPEIQLVVFDLGGVLVRAARTFAEAYAHAQLAPHAVVSDAAFLNAHDAIAAQYVLGRISTSEYCERVANASGGALTQQVAERVLHAWSQQEYEGVNDIFDLLDRVSVPSAVLSNTNAAHWSRLADRLSPQPEYPTVLRATHLFASHELGLAKPEPAIFSALVEATRVSVDRLLFFDDVIENVTAGRAAGWHAEHIDRDADPPGQILRHLKSYGIA